MIKMCFIAGVQKCGTSSMFALLCQHPHIGGAQRWETGRGDFPPKELHVFNTNDYRRGRDWYESHFGTHSWCIDATPEYLASLKVMKRVRSFGHQSRVIIMLRDPVARAVSAWKHWVRLSQKQGWQVPLPNESFLANFKAERKVLMQAVQRYDFSGILSRGLYAEQVKMARKLFGENQVRVVFFEEAIHETDRVVGETFEWLQLKPVAVESRHLNKAAEMATGAQSDILDAEAALRAFYRPHNAELRKMLNRALPNQWS